MTNMNAQWSPRNKLPVDPQVTVAKEGRRPIIVAVIGAVGVVMAAIVPVAVSYANGHQAQVAGVTTPATTSVTVPARAPAGQLVPQPNAGAIAPATTPTTPSSPSGGSADVSLLNGPWQGIVNGSEQGHVFQLQPKSVAHTSYAHTLTATLNCSGSESAVIMATYKLGANHPNYFDAMIGIGDDTTNGAAIYGVALDGKDTGATGMVQFGDQPVVVQLGVGSAKTISILFGSANTTGCSPTSVVVINPRLTNSPQ
jgi:hypothetical protein